MLNRGWKVNDWKPRGYLCPNIAFLNSGKCVKSIAIISLYWSVPSHLQGIMFFDLCKYVMDDQNYWKWVLVYNCLQNLVNSWKINRLEVIFLKFVWQKLFWFLIPRIDVRCAVLSDVFQWKLTFLCIFLKQFLPAHCNLAFYFWI